MIYLKKEIMMKPSKIKYDNYDNNPIIEKLLNLKYRINDAYRNGNKPSNGDTNTRDDKTWVMNLITDVRNNEINTLCREDMLKCNGLWRKYAG